jgi:glutaminyl-tRNA synthetase
MVSLKGEAVLRAKIDMASQMCICVIRFCIVYLHSEHHQTGDKWKMYPMYDYAHPLSDAIEGLLIHSVL